MILSGGPIWPEREGSLHNKILPIPTRINTVWIHFHGFANNQCMTTYNVRVGFHNPSALTFRQLDEILEQQRFWRTGSRSGEFRYFMEYKYESELRNLCEVCELVYSQACKVKRCPLVLVVANVTEE